MATAVATPEEIEEQMDIANSLAFLMPVFHVQGLDGWGTDRANIVDNINDNNMKTDVVSCQEIHVVTHQEVDMDAVQSFLLLVSKLYKYGDDGVGRRDNNTIDNDRADDHDTRQPINQPTAHRKIPKLKFYLCNQCVYATKTKAHIISHKLSHTDERPYLCPRCPRRFNRVDVRTRHINTVHRKLKPFKCPKCGNGFGRADHLSKHLKIHKK